MEIKLEQKELPLQEVIIHIGLHKTGTTSIQDNLFKYRGELESLGYSYPVFKRNGRTFTNHSLLFFSLYCKNPLNYHINIKEFINTKEKLDALHTSYRSQLESFLKHNNNKIIISGEDISSLSLSGIENLKNDFELLLGRPLKFHIFCCTRAPLSYWQSDIQQRVRGGRSIDDIYEFLKKLFTKKYRNSLEKFIQVFGKNSVTVYKYEDVIKSGLGPFNYFIGKLGPDIRQTFTEDKRNESFCHEAIELISYINKQIPFFINSEINTKRKIGDVSIFRNIKGSKFTLDKDQSNQILDLSVDDCEWLYDNFAVDYKSDVKGDIIENKYWSDSVKKQIKELLPKLDTKLKDLVLKFCNERSIDLKFSESVNS